MENTNIKTANDSDRRLNMDAILTGVCFVLLLIIVVIPIFMIIYNAFFDGGKFSMELFTTQMTDSKNLSAMWNTVQIAILTTIIGTIMGVFYAWLLGRSDIPAKGLMRALFYEPLCLPAGRLAQPSENQKGGLRAAGGSSVDAASGQAKESDSRWEDFSFARRAV